MFVMSNEEYLLAASPNVRPGGGNPPGSVTMEPPFLSMEAMTIILKDKCRNLKNDELKMRKRYFLADLQTFLITALALFAVSCADNDLQDDSDNGDKSNYGSFRY